MCILAVDEAVGSPLVFKAGGSTCRSYLCEVPEYRHFGQSVSVRSTSSAVSYDVSDVQSWAFMLIVRTHHSQMKRVTSKSTF